MQNSPQRRNSMLSIVGAAYVANISICNCPRDVLEPFNGAMGTSAAGNGFLVCGAIATTLLGWYEVLRSTASEFDLH